jgi:hypothetical protein
MKLVNESLGEFLNINEKKKEPEEREAYSIKFKDDKFEITNSEKKIIKTFSSKELISFLSNSGFSSINAKSTADDLKSGDKKIKVFLANPKIFS